MEWAGIAIDVAWFASLKERFQRERERVEQEIYVSGRRGVQHQLQPAAARRSCSISCSCPCENAPRRARRPMRACCRSSPMQGTQLPVAAHGVSRALEAREHVPRRAAGAHQPARRAAAHVVQPDRRGDRPALIERSESPEHSDSARARARHPPRLRAAEGLAVPRRRLLADRAATSRAPLARSGVRRGVQVRRRHSPADGGDHLRRAASTT